jgi:hypothetical protein
MKVPQFTADASLQRASRDYRSITLATASHGSGGVSPALVGRWQIAGCEVVCIEVCTRFCAPTGWDCCEWETRCSLNCPGFGIRIW